MESPPSDRAGGSGSVIETLGRWIGLTLHIVIGWLYLTSGLVAPFWAVGLLMVVWTALLVGVIRFWRSRPWLVLATPFLAFLIWVGVLTLGERLLDWTA
jgi:hypothetical protein